MRRNSTKSVSCDLNTTYIAIASKMFPHATIYADKFHVSKLVTSALDKVHIGLRHEMERAYRDKEISEDVWHTQKKVLHKAKSLILTRRTCLGLREKECIEAAFTLNGSYDMKKAYLVLQRYFEWADKAYSSREEMQRALKEWISLANRSKISEMTSTASTVKKYMNYIINAWQDGYTNAIAEALNRRIKDIIRECRGFKGFEGLKRRCLLVLGHKRTQTKPIPLFIRRSKLEVVEN